MSGDHSSGSGEDRTGLALLGILLALVIFISAMAHRPAGGSGPVCGNPGLVGTGQCLLGGVLLVGPATTTLLQWE